MNKRQTKKKWKKETPKEFQICQECGKSLDYFTPLPYEVGNL